MKQRAYVAIDLKSFYASVECMDLERDPLTTNLVVADRSRTEKTICLAVSPSLKKWGIPGRARLFEVEQRLKEVNRQRQQKAPGRVFTGESDDDEELSKNPSLKIGYIAARPRMARYMDVSILIYKNYLRYIAPEDIHVYSIDEVFMDVTNYLGTYNKTPRELAAAMIDDIRSITGITATAGIGTNLYLCKVAMDIVAKHVPADENGVRIAELDEMSYRRTLWDHKPLTDFWRVGKGYVKKLSELGLETMGDIARCSLGGERDMYNEKLLYKSFGVNAELLIDHAWGYEPCTIDLIKAYKPENHSLTQGQVLHCASSYDTVRIIVREMADALAMQLLGEGKVTNQIVLTIGYDRESLENPEIARNYRDKIKKDYYGRAVPEHLHGSKTLEKYTSLGSHIIDAALSIYDEKVDKKLLMRRINIAAVNVLDEEEAKKAGSETYEQLSLFEDIAEKEEKKQREKAMDDRERALQEAALAIKRRFGNNAIVKGTSMQEGATGLERGRQIGGHKA